MHQPEDRCQLDRITQMLNHRQTIRRREPTDSFVIIVKELKTLLNCALGCYSSCPKHPLSIICLVFRVNPSIGMSSQFGC